MRKLYLLFPVLLFFSPLSRAQEGEEVLLDGLIVVPEGTSPEGIHVFNRANNQGSVASSGGRFEILVREGDTLYLSGIQFEMLEVTITEGMMASQIIRVEIQEGLNQLPEVVVREHDLSGNLSQDAQVIEIEDFEIPSVPLPVGPPKGVDAPVNTALNEIRGGANILGLLGAGIGMLFPKRIKEAPLEKHHLEDQIHLRRRLRALLGDSFFIEELDLQKDEIADFLEFSIGPDFQSKMLEDQQRLDLLQYLIEGKESFRSL